MTQSSVDKKQIMAVGVILLVALFLIPIFKGLMNLANGIGNIIGGVGNIFGTPVEVKNALGQTTEQQNVLFKQMINTVNGADFSQYSTDYINKSESSIATLVNAKMLTPKQGEFLINLIEQKRKKYNK